MPTRLFALLFMLFLAGCGGSPPPSSGETMLTYELAFKGFTPAQSSQMENYLRSQDAPSSLNVGVSSRPTRLYRYQTLRVGPEVENLLQRMLSDLALHGRIGTNGNRIEVTRGDFRLGDCIPGTTPLQDYTIQLKGFSATDIRSIEEELRRLCGCEEVRLSQSQGSSYRFVVRVRASATEVRRELSEIMAWFGLLASVDFTGSQFTVILDGTRVTISPPPPPSPTPTAYNHRVRLLNFSDWEAQQAAAHFTRFSGYRNHQLNYSHPGDREYLLSIVLNGEELSRNLRKVLWEMSAEGSVEVIDGIHVLRKTGSNHHPAPPEESGEGRWNNLGERMRSNR